MSLRNVVAIVGRPNVGKSALFNRLAGRRISIVHEEPGVTRDRLEAKLSWNGLALRLVDTGGIDLDVKDELHRQVQSQVLEALAEASLVLFTVDGRAGITSLDEEVSSWIRRSGKKNILVVNKIDNPRFEIAGREFHRLGFDPLVMISALHGLGIIELQEKIEECLARVPEEEETSLRVAVVGKPNVGKSTLINTILGKMRLVVDERPGTTRDAVDVEARLSGRLFTFVDTAGLRQRRKIRSGVETFSMVRTLKSLHRCDVAILVVDVFEGVTAQDVRILDEIRKSAKGCVIAMNKWDRVSRVREKDFLKFLFERWKFFEIYPCVFCSAKTGLHIDRLIEQVIEIDEGMHREIPEEELAAFLERLIKRRQPPSEAGHVPRFYGMVQAKQAPIQLNTDVNDVNFIKESYKLFIENEFRKTFRLSGVPIKFNYRSVRKSGIRGS